MTRYLRRTVAIATALLGGTACLDACSVQYSAAPISAQVVDAETGQPVPGVIVVAHWQLEGGLEGGSNLGAVTVMEAETDGSGRFQFPAWGPKEVERPSGFYANAHIRNAAPEMVLFTTGYENQRLLNYGSAEPDPKNMHSDWDGKTIKLKRFQGTPAAYARSLGSLSDDLIGNVASFPRSCSAGKPCPAACQWQNIPKTIRAIRRQLKSLETAGVRNSGIYGELTSNDEVYRRAGCASAAAVLGGAGE